MNVEAQEHIICKTKSQSQALHPTNQAKLTMRENRSLHDYFQGLLPNALNLSSWDTVKLKVVYDGAKSPYTSWKSHHRPPNRWSLPLPQERIPGSQCSRWDSIPKNHRYPSVKKAAQKSREPIPPVRRNSFCGEDSSSSSSSDDFINSNHIRPTSGFTPITAAECVEYVPHHEMSRKQRVLSHCSVWRTGKTYSTIFSLCWNVWLWLRKSSAMSLIFVLCQYESYWMYFDSIQDKRACNMHRVCMKYSSLHANRLPKHDYYYIYYCN